MKNRNFIGLIILLIFSACSTEQTRSVEAYSTVEEVRPEKSAIQHLSPVEAKILLEENKNLVVLDVRTPAEFNRGHLENAVNLDFQAPDFEEKIKALEPDRNYLIYCAAGGRSSKAADLMQKYGFTYIYNCQKGYKDLKDTGLPVK